MDKKDNNTLEIDKRNIPDSPIPISFYSIYYALKSVFPDQADLIFSGIKKIYVTNNEMLFNTIGITKDKNLIINKTFWNTFVLDHDSLKTLLTHELYHYVLGDIYSLLTEEDDKEYELKNAANNIAMDSRINAAICNIHPEINPQDFFVRLYDDKKCEEFYLHKILRPGSKLDPNDLNESQVIPFYNKFYSEQDICSHRDLAKVVEELLRKDPNMKGKNKLKIKLLGSHGQDALENLSEEDLKNADVIEIDMSGLTREQLEELKKAQKAGQAQEERQQNINGGQENNIKEALLDAISSALQAGKSSQIAQTLINTCREITEKFDINRFKKMAFDNIFHNVRSQARIKTGTYSTSPILPVRYNNFDLIKIALDIPVPFYKTKKYVNHFDKNLLPIYLDVSGSTTPYLPEIVRLIANVSEQLDYVWGFSNIIHKHTIKDLDEGKITTTGGTDFDCVLDHAEKEQFEHIVVITDGYASTRRGDQRPQWLKSVVTILFGGATKQNYFTELYENTHMIDEVKI